MAETSSLELVLVHGGWSDGSCWSSVISHLMDVGIEASAAQLPLSSFDEDVMALRHHLEARQGKTILVGHSYGGLVMTQVGGESAQTVGLVYVAASIPLPGEGLGSFLLKNPGAYQAQFTPDKNGLLWASEGVFAEGLAQDLCSRQRRLLVSVQKPLSAAIFGANISVEGWRNKPCWYLISEDDRILSPTTQRALAHKINAKTGMVSGGHMSPISQPKKVAQFLQEVAIERDPDYQPTFRW